MDGQRLLRNQAMWEKHTQWTDGNGKEGRTGRRKHVASALTLGRRISSGMWRSQSEGSTGSVLPPVMIGD